MQTDQMNPTLEAFGRLMSIMDELREKCPWDKKQTTESLRHLTIEEVYELGDAILSGDMKGIRNELGDLLLHIVFYTRIASESNGFTMKDVLDGICEKLIHRHPHIYGDVKVEDADEVKRNWEKLKMKEGKTSVMEGVPLSLPAMVKASRIQEKARGASFDWEKAEDVWEKVLEEMRDLKEAEAAGTSGKSNAEEELGDLLFAVINYARFIGVNPEDALERTNRKFLQRFRSIEDHARKAGKTLDAMSLQEMDAVWEEAKKVNGKR